MIISTKDTTINFDDICFMFVEDDCLIFESTDENRLRLHCKSSEDAHQTRRFIESAYIHGEKICKI